MMDPEKVLLTRLRKICLALPDAEEQNTWGHPNFRVRGKIFVVLQGVEGDMGIAVKVGKLMQGVFLDDPRFFRTPYVGKHGWVTLRVHAAPLNWVEIREVVEESYRQTAPTVKKKPSARTLGKRKTNR